MQVLDIGYYYQNSQKITHSFGYDRYINKTTILNHFRESYDTQHSFGYLMMQLWNRNKASQQIV